jgi:uncharacterized protein (DUF885 family)
VGDAEVLAIENGWYDDHLPSKLGALQGQLWRAQRLVVDTGLHTKGWTRQQAIDYGISVSEVERYVAWPGQACAYMIGQLKILELRDKTRRELGDKFSLKEFHNVVSCTQAPFRSKCWRKWWTSTSPRRSNLNLIESLGH